MDARHTRRNGRALFIRVASALSLSALAHYAAWSWALEDGYFPLNDNPLITIVLIAANLLGAAFAFALMSPSPRLRRTRAGGGILLCVVLAALYVHWWLGRESVFIVALGSSIPPGRLADLSTSSALLCLATLALLALALAYIALKASRQYRWVAAAAPPLVALAPFSLILYVQGLVVTFDRLDGDPTGRDLAKSAGAASGSPLIFLIMDELDYHLTFERRSASPDFPNFDRLASSGLRATQATTSTMFTDETIPSITTGESVVAAEINEAGDDVVLRVEGASGPKLWSRQKTIFSELRRRGLTVSVVGWYHPYCRLFGEVLGRCYWAPFYDFDTGGTGKVEHALRWYVASWRNLAVATPARPSTLLPRPGTDWLGIASRRHLAATRDIERAVRTVIRDGLPDLFYIHFPFPHWPPLPREDGLIDQHDAYLRNLVAADRFLGRLLSDLGASGQAERTAIILTGDHPARPKDHPDYFKSFGADKSFTGDRVPFIVRLPGQEDAVTVDLRFENTVAHDLILDYFDGAFSTHSDIEAWLNGRAEPPDARGIAANTPTPG